MSRMQIYMSEIAENIEKEGDAAKEYQALKTRIIDDVHFAKGRLQEQELYDQNPEPPVDENGERVDIPPMTQEEIEKTKKFLSDAMELLETIDEIISDEMNHSLKLLGKMTKFGNVHSSEDGLANAIQEICKPKDGVGNDD